MKNNDPIAIIGGYDSIAGSFFLKTKELNKDSIFINVHEKKIKKINVYNYEVFQFRKILDTLKFHKIRNLLFIGKISRPNLAYFKKDGIIDKYIPLLINSYMQGDGKVLQSIIKIFREKGFKILSPNKVSSSFFFKI